MRLVDADAYSAEMKERQKAAWKWRNEAIAEEDEVKLARAEGAYTAFTEAKLTMDKHIINPWHRAEDELPDKYTQCLVADADGKCAVGYYRYDCKAWDNPAFGWIEMENRMYIDDIPMGIGKVVAWMPIEPPKEGTNE